ncbi:MAG: tetratricopeptide repeat protein [Bacteroidetes bacterium]|nr:tetratricopeptide repeat protein [Bacteroidota bacterium]
MHNKLIIIICILSFYGANAYAQNTQSILQKAFSKSYVLEDKEQFSEAIKEIANVYDKNSYEINLRLGWLNLSAQKYEKSIEYYSISKNIMPKAIEPLLGEAMAQKKIESWLNVESIYLSILELDSKNTKANYELGVIYYYRKDYTTAKKHLDIVLNLYPFDYETMLMSAWNHYQLKNMTNAKVLFHKVLLNHPNDISALEGLENIN